MCASCLTAAGDAAVVQRQLGDCLLAAHHYQPALHAYKAALQLCRHQDQQQQHPQRQGQQQMQPQHPQHLEQGQPQAVVQLALTRQQLELEACCAAALYPQVTVLAVS